MNVVYLYNGRAFFVLVVVIDYDKNPEMENIKKSTMKQLEKTKRQL
jgi:hypothetical protein